MKRNFLVATAAIGLCIVVSDVQAQTSNVNWFCKVFNQVGSYTSEYQHIVTREGSAVFGTGFPGCKQETLRVFKDKNNDLQEQVRITCEVGINTHISVMTNCYALKTDQNFAAMSIDDGVLNKFTIALSCKRE